MKVGAVLGILGLLSCLALSAQERIPSPTAERKTSPTYRGTSPAYAIDAQDAGTYVAKDDSFREMLPTVFLPIQSRNPKALAAGRLLVASRNLGDPNFVHTVVLLVRYDAQGVVGLVLNRRTDIPLSRVLDGVKAAKDRSDPVYLGGPVETPGVFALLRSPTKIEGSEQIFSGVYLISAKTVFEQTISARPDPNAFHVYMGNAGWTREQLQMEVQLGAWFIFPADAATVFNSDPDSLWFQMIRKTELKFTKSEPADANPWARDAQFGDLGYSR